MTDPANSEKQNLHIPFIKYNCVRRLNQSDDKWEWYVSSANIIQSSVGNYLLISLINTSKSNFSVVRKQLYYVTCTWTILINNNLFLKIHSVNHPPNIVLNVQLYIWCRLQFFLFILLDQTIYYTDQNRSTMNISLDNHNQILLHM